MKHVLNEKMMQCRTLFLSCIVLFVLIGFPLINSVGASSIIWSKTFGGDDMDACTSMVQTADGGFALAGYTASFGEGGIDMWLIKVDANGNTQWDQTYGGIDQEGAFALIQTYDGAFVVAGYTESYGAGGSDIFLVKVIKTTTTRKSSTINMPGFFILIGIILFFLWSIKKDKIR